MWRNGVIRPAFTAAIVMPLIVGGAFAGVAYGMYVNEMYSFRQIGAFACVSYFMAGGALFIGYLLLKGLVAAARFHGARLRLLTNPGVIGGDFSGELWLPPRGDRKAEVLFHLINEARTTASDSDRSDHVRPHFEYKIRGDGFEHSRDGRYMVVPFAFTIPSDTHDETERVKIKQRTTTYDWMLKASCPARGIDLQFRVPIFHTPDSRADVSRASLPKMSFKELYGDAEQRSFVAINDSGRKVVYACKAIRAIKMRIALLLMALMFLLVPCVFFGAVFRENEPRFLEAVAKGHLGEALQSGIFVVLPSLMGLVSLAAGLGFFLWFALGVATRVTTISAEGLRIRIGLGPIRFGGFVPFSDIAKVSMETSESLGGRSLYDIRVTFKPRSFSSRWRKLNVMARSVPSEEEARWLLKHIRDSIGRFSDRRGQQQG